MKYSQGSLVKNVLYIFAIVLIVVIGVFVYAKNSKRSGTIIDKPLEKYVSIIDSAVKLTPLILSHHPVSISSPWGKETNYRGNADSSLGQYTFAKGVRVTLTVQKLSPRESLKKGEGLSTDEIKQFESAYDFIQSKIGIDLNSYNYAKFMYEATNQSVMDAKNQTDKDGYSSVLAIKNMIMLHGKDSVLDYHNDYGKGFVWIPQGSDLPNAVDIWSKKGIWYSFTWPANQSISRTEIDAFMNSIKITD